MSNRAKMDRPPFIMWPKALLNNKELGSGHEVLTFMVLLSNANVTETYFRKRNHPPILIKRGQCFLSRQEIANILELSISTITRSLKNLEANGKIKVLSIERVYSLFEIVDFDRFQGSPDNKKVSFKEKMEEILKSGLTDLEQIAHDFSLSKHQVDWIRTMGFKEINRRWAIPKERSKMFIK